MSISSFPICSLGFTTYTPTTAGNGFACPSQGQIRYLWDLSPQRRQWRQDGNHEREVPRRPREDHNGCFDRVAGREGGGGVVGEFDIDSEEEQIIAYG